LGSGSVSNIAENAHPAIMSGILKILESLGAELKVCILRGFDFDSERIGFDIDLLISVKHVLPAREIIENLATELPLFIAVNKGSEEKFKVFIALVSGDTLVRGRRWALLDFQTALPPGLVVGNLEAASEYHCTQPTGFRGVTTLTKAFSSALETVRKSQGVRANRPRFSGNCEMSKESQEFLIGESQDRINHPLEQRHWLRWDRKTSSWKRSTLIAFSKIFFFLPLFRARLYVVSGADGVGKSTVCELIGHHLSMLPIKMDQFHHSKYVKERSNKHGKATNKSNDRGWIYLALRSIWRLLVPASLKHFLLGLLNECKYVFHLNKRTTCQTLSNHVLLSDRYSFDRFIKAQFSEKTTGQRLLFYIGDWMCNDPAHIFVLTDKPDLIYSRKQELTPEEIESYQIRLLALLGKRELTVDEIMVDGQSPSALAERITRMILTSLGESLFALLSTWESERREVDA